MGLQGTADRTPKPVSLEAPVQISVLLPPSGEALGKCQPDSALLPSPLPLLPLLQSLGLPFYSSHLLCLPRAHACCSFGPEPSRSDFHGTSSFSRLSAQFSPLVNTASWTDFPSLPSAVCPSLPQHAVISLRE